MDAHLFAMLSIPLFSGAIGYVTNWSGVWMIFNPITFVGVRIPGLKTLASLLPRKIQQVPGIMQGGVGWQGIIPSRAAKMGSIAVDKGIAKLGGAADFYRQLEPDAIAEHILATSEGDIRELVERIMERENAQLWADLPPRVREMIHARVRAQLPKIVHEVTEQIGENIDQLLDVKLMVIRHIEADPRLANRIYAEVGERELKFVRDFGFWFGLALGVPVVLVTELVPHWWVLPILGTVVGYVTNLVALKMIFEPIEPKRYGPFTHQGLFLRRQSQAADAYATVIADDIVTLRNIGEELLTGPRSDRTRNMIERALRPAVDQAVGFARPAVQMAVGRREYEAIRESVATEAVDYTMVPLQDPAFNKRQSDAIRELISTRMREMPPRDFSEMLRAVLEEDEWLLVLHGAVLGFGAGLVHLAIFGV